jgi:DNA-binding transcriptional regulator YhcF (GntR family)
MNITLDKKKTLRRELEDNIISGIYRKGVKVPSERRLGEQYNISRPVVRTVVQDMISDGLIKRPLGRRASFITDDALDLLIGQKNSAEMTLNVVIPGLWMNNPLIIKMFSVLEKHLHSAIRFKVHLGDWLSLLLENPDKADVLVVFNDSGHVYPMGEDIRRKIKSKFKDVIIINERVDGLNYIGPDHEAGGRLMAQHLLKNNHKTVGCVIKEHIRLNDAALRHRGFKEEFSKYGKVIDTLFTFSGQISLPILADLVFYQEPATSALACFQDRHAAVVYEAFRQRNKLQIPKDISVIGFDDQYFSQYMSPPLTTVKYPAEIIGNRLAEYINELFQGKATGIDEEIVPVLMDRGSVAKI